MAWVDGMFEVRVYLIYTTFSSVFGAERWEKQTNKDFFMIPRVFILLLPSLMTDKAERGEIAPVPA